MASYILAVDQSTSATKAILFDTQGRLAHRANRSHQQHYPKPGWVEHDPEEIWQNTLGAIADVLAAAGLDLSEARRQIQVLAITNQRETIMAWDRETGKPVYPAITWQCNRADAICRALEAQGEAETVRARSGLVLSPYFSAAKAAWILNEVPGVRAGAESGRILLGTMDSWLTWNLTGGQVHATDCSNASRTQLFNIFEKRWDDRLLGLFSIPKAMLPQVRFSDERFGAVAPGAHPVQQALAGLPIAGVMGDSHAALFGQNCFGLGMAKATYGTGSSIMMNIGATPRLSGSGLVTSVAWGRGGTIEYVFEGNINCTGATIQWLVDDLQLLASPKESSAWAESVPDNGGVYLVPAFVGLGAPYWDSAAKASLTGMTRATRKAHVVRAAEESIAYQIKDIVDLMLRESQLQIPELRVDGGPTRDAFLMQFQSDMLGIPVACARIEELSALGVCLMGGLATGLWPDLDAIGKLRETGKRYEPQMPENNRNLLYLGWQAAVKRTLSRQQQNQE